MLLGLNVCYNLFFDTKSGEGHFKGWIDGIIYIYILKLTYILNNSLYLFLQIQ
jgi:hypothetical protein